MSVKGLVLLFVKKKNDKLLISPKWSIKSPQLCYCIEKFYFHYIFVFATFMYCNKSVVMIFVHGRSVVKRERGSYILLIKWEQRLAFSECSNIKWLCYTATQHHRKPLPSQVKSSPWSVWMFCLNECQWQLHTFVSFV